MLFFRHTERLPFPQDYLFSLITDVEAYPQFLPWCQSCTVMRREGSILKAKMNVGWAGLQETFFSHVTLTPSHQVIAEAQGGIFHTMKTQWDLTPLENLKGQPSTQVLFTVEFSLKSSFLTLLVKSGFSPVCHQMVQAFCTRAQDLCPSN